MIALCRVTATVAVFSLLVFLTPLHSGAEGPAGSGHAVHEGHGGSTGKDGDLFGATSHRRFDDAEYWSGVFDAPDRRKWQQADAVIAKLEIRDGMSVADLGAGTGFFLAALSKAVGEGGNVYAVEVEPTLVAHMRERAEKEGAANVVPVLGSLDNPRLPTGALDRILIVDTYHHLDDRLTYLKSLRTNLRDGGNVVVIDWRPGKLDKGPPPDHKIPPAQVKREMERAGYKLATEYDFLHYQYFMVFE